MNRNGISRQNRLFLLSLAFACSPLSLNAEPRSEQLAGISGVLDRAFDPSSGPNGPVNSLALLSFAAALKVHIKDPPVFSEPHWASEIFN